MGHERWLAAFLGGGPRAAELFTEDALWRDYLAFHWDLQTFEGLEAIAASLKSNACTLANSCEVLSDSEVIFDFHGPNGQSKGYAELHDGKASILFTSLEELNGGTPTATDDCPFVLIIGAGQGGLALAARLRHLGVPHLVCEKHARVGDNWRNRYESLVLHDPTWVNHLPHKPFPDDWPTFTPKDMMGDWLEGYANDLGLNVKCDCKVSKASFDGQGKLWRVELASGGKTETVFVPHLVFAVGTSGFPRQQKFDGEDSFAGQQLHSSAFISGAEYAGQRVAIIGATNSAHDIAVDLVGHGARPTMVQRGSTHVVPHQVHLEEILGPLYATEHNRPLSRADFLSAATPMRRLEQKGRAIFDQAQRDWEQFFDMLRNMGFALDFAEDGSGMIGKYRRTASGYYIDVGGSQLVMDGRIAVRSGAGVRAIEPDGVLLDDGTKLAADAMIYATGYGSMEEWVARIIDEQTADKIGRCWGYGSGYRGDPGPWEGELRNMWKPTAQEGLWFMGGNLAQARIYSHYLALQLAHRFQNFHGTDGVSGQGRKDEIAA